MRTECAQGTYTCREHKNVTRRGHTYEGNMHTEGHTWNAHRENIHMEGTYTRRDVHMDDIHMRGHAHRGGIHMEGTYTRRGHTHGRVIHTVGHKYERTYTLKG